jgi:hypothetical protein
MGGLRRRGRRRGEIAVVAAAPSGRSHCDWPGGALLVALTDGMLNVICMTVTPIPVSPGRLTGVLSVLLVQKSSAFFA